ncbi:CTTNBP2 N-terminal-like protein [Halyomorpha halys]|uniref:CTTNBP2 N-terminal-like protein n=1 Tax=Halyomorpha halys TaxID=286706 RepID=UPI0006D4E1F2
MVSNMSLKVVAENQCIKLVEQNGSSDTIKCEINFRSSTNTLKRNPKMELCKSDLLKLLSCLEGELQARDIVIATLKCEKMKYMLSQGQYKSSCLSDPISALHRDGFAAPSRSIDQADLVSIDQQKTYLENLSFQLRKSQIRMAKILKDAELRHCKVIEELILEKRKHEHDTAQGDDITYGLEKERSRLKQDLEAERQAKKRLEKDLKKISDVSDEDKNRQKQIVLLLLAERKKIIMKYIEERKRSEDLAQILSEEKSRIDSMAEGLEEESKKSLQMEAELEKQLAQFDTESQILKANLQREEKRVKELEAELEKSRNETAVLEKQLAEYHQMIMHGNVTNFHNRPPFHHTIRHPVTGWEGMVAAGSPAHQGNSAMGSSVAKVIQPTATVSSVPVSGPTTGVARSISPGHGIRSIGYCSQVQSPIPAKIEKRVTTSSIVTANSKAVPSSHQRPLPTVGPSNGTDKKQPVPRGVPPPVPPNKPVVPPKKDSVLIRRGDNTNVDTSKFKEIKQNILSENQEVAIDDHSETYQNISSSSQSGVV